MSPEHPRLRGGQNPHRAYPFGEFPDDIIQGIGKQIVHRLAVGHADITGDDWGGIFANAISGDHLHSPVGLTDIIWNSTTSWSAKTVQATNPFTIPLIRLISGRCSPDYSHGIADAHADLALTGAAVLSIWNARVDQSKANYDDLRVVVLIRNMTRLEFTLFEYEPVRFSPGDYEWRIGTTAHRSNLYGFERATGEQRFTWQFHGSQFTIHKLVPGSAAKFKITRHPGLIEQQHVLDLIGFRPEWIVRVP